MPTVREWEQLLRQARTLRDLGQQLVEAPVVMEAARDAQEVLDGYERRLQSLERQLHGIIESRAQAQQDLAVLEAAKQALLGEVGQLQHQLQALTRAYEEAV